MYKVHGACHDFLAENGKNCGKVAEEMERSRDFADVLKKLEAMQETSQQRAQRLEQEAAAAAERRRKNRRINELRGLIAQLKTKLVNSGYSKKVEGELSAAQHELYWLMMGF